MGSGGGGGGQGGKALSSLHSATRLESVFSEVFNPVLCLCYVILVSIITVPIVCVQKLNVFYFHFMNGFFFSAYTKSRYPQPTCGVSAGLL